MVITVVNLKGGTGKTTSAFAIATALSRQGTRVKIYDADPQGSATDWADIADLAGEDLPFTVSSANVATCRRIARNEKGVEGEWAIVDCPPNGQVVDAAIMASDYVLVPSQTGVADVSKSIEVAQIVAANDIPCRVLITRAVPRLLSTGEAMSDFAAAGVPVCGVVIPQREALKSVFGHSFDDELYGYEVVANEIVEEVSRG